MHARAIERFGIAGKGIPPFTVRKEDLSRRKRLIKNENQSRISSLVDSTCREII